LPVLVSLIQRFKRNLLRESNLRITKQFVKIKFCDFKSTTAETTKKGEVIEQTFFDLFKVGFDRYNKPVRLLGVGVRFGK
jgi:DNA polymerase-4